jgi:hypothetical protein
MAEKQQSVEKAPTVSAMDAKKESLKANLRYQRDKDRELVRGVFKFYEVEGGSLNFVHRAYKEDQVERYDLIDGQIYTLPLGVAKHLNKSGWYPVHAFAQTESGVPVAKIGQKVRRYGFSSLEFVDIDDLTPIGGPLVTVENVRPGSTDYMLDQYNKG